MGLLFEYSNPDQPVYRSKPEPEPTAVPEQVVAEASPATETQAPEPVYTIRGQDIAIASVLVVIAFIGLAFVSAFVFAIFIAVQTPDLLNTTDPATAAQELIAPLQTAYLAQYLYTGILYALALIAGTAFVARKATWRGLGFIRLENDRLQYALLMGAVAAIGISGGNLLAAELAGTLNDLSTSITNLLNDTQPWIPLLVLLTAIVVLPFAEEVFFRGLIYNWLRQRGQIRMAVIVTSIAYAALNLNPIGFLPNILLGVGLALIFERTQSLWGAYFAHSTFNFVSIVIYLGIVLFN